MLVWGVVLAVGVLVLWWFFIYLLFLFFYSYLWRIVCEEYRKLRVFICSDIIDMVGIITKIINIQNRIFNNTYFLSFALLKLPIVTGTISFSYLFHQWQDFFALVFITLGKFLPNFTLLSEMLRLYDPLILHLLI